MKKTYKVCWLITIALLLIGFVAQPTGQSQAATGFSISGRNLLDANGNNFIIRGISHAHTWYTSQTSSFANIKAAGANTVRVVLSGGRWTANSASDVANVISLCKTNKLICVLEDHDTTGYGEQSGAYTLDQAVTYWKSIQSVLTGQEAYVIINIGNEPYGNNNPADWTAATKNAIAALRSAGFQHTIMVDAPNWGQDWQFVMRDNAASVFASDPNRNTIFSIHMYGVFDTAAEIQSYVSTFVNAGLPLVIGEFGNNHSDGDPDEDTIMSQAVANGIGYMGWSWCGNSSDVAYLDMVTNWDPTQLTTWGQRIINGTNGIKATAKQCTVYDTNVTPTRTPTRTNTNTTPNTPTYTPTRTNTGTTPTYTPTRTQTQGTGACQVAYTKNQWGGGFTADVKITNNSSSAINGWTLTWSFANGQQVTSAWNATVTQSGVNVSAVNVGYNGTLAANGGTVSFGFQATYSGTNADPTNFALNGVACNGGDVTPTRTPTQTNTGTTPTYTPTRTNTSVTPTRTPTRTNTGTTPTYTPTRTQTQGTGACQVSYTTNQWSTGFTADVKITNNSTAAISGWTLTWTFANGQQITGAWNATVTQSGATVTASNPASHWNGTIGANGGSVAFGFQATHSGTNATPTNFALNGVTCQ